MICGIYKITSPTGKIYVGQSVNIHKRWSKYKRLECINQRRLYNSFQKHGVKNHIFEIIEECEKENLNKKERHYQDLYNVLDKGLNLTLTNDENGYKVITEETRLKIKLSRLGTKHSDESIEKMKKYHQANRIKKIKIKKENTLKIKVICTVTNKIWNSIKECAVENNIHPRTLGHYLKGDRKNNTTFKYLKNEII